MSTKMVAVSLMSQDRDVDAYPEASDFTIDLGVNLQRVKEVRLGSFEMCAPTQLTVEEGWNDAIVYGEGWRVDTGEAPRTVDIDSSVAPFNAPALYNHQLLIAQQTFDSVSQTVRYLPTMNIVLTVPAWLMEVETYDTAALVSSAGTFAM